MRCVGCCLVMVGLLVGCVHSGIDERGRVGENFVVSVDPRDRDKERTFKDTVELQQEVIRRQEQEIQRLNQQLQDLEYQRMLNKATRR